MSSACNGKDLLAGLIFDRIATPSITNVWKNAINLSRLVLRFKTAYSDPRDPSSRSFYYKLTVAAYPALMMTTSAFSSPASAPPGASFGGPVVDYSHAFDFCGFDCSILSYRLQDIGNSAVTDFAYSLKNGSCGEVFALSLE